MAPWRTGLSTTRPAASSRSPSPPPATTRSKVRDLAEALDAHRKRQQEQHPGLGLTDMYNVLEKLRGIECRGVLPYAQGAQQCVPTITLSAKERLIHEQGLVSVLKQIHDDLDRAVADAYGWPADLPDEELLARLVALNAERAREEANGLVRWLRPEYQNPQGAPHPASGHPLPKERGGSTPRP